ncbi:hypothetical protein FHG87_010421 [Trinorchestia longiramus]|nr:hypothetical protein FHG87_010421 [Trinorchestia longiramus]
MYRVLKEDLGKKPYKKMKHHELTECHERMRAERSRHIFNEIAQGTLPNFVFRDEKKFDIQQNVNHQNDRVWRSSSSVEGKIVTRRQNAQSVVSILETRVLATPHTFLESLEAKLQREWEAIPQEQIRAACDAFVYRLKAVVLNKGGYIE